MEMGKKVANHTRAVAEDAQKQMLRTYRTAQRTGRFLSAEREYL